MDWFNYIGLIIVAAILTPNIVYALKHDHPDNNGIPKALAVLENIGRYGCMVFMVFNIPYTWFPLFIEGGLVVYIVVNAVLAVAYIVLFIAFWNKSGMAKAMLLSVIPSLIFLFSGIMLISLPLLLFATLFAYSHVFISAKTV